MRERVLLVVDCLMLLSIVLEFLDIAGEVILLLLQVLLLALVSFALLTVVLVTDGCDLLGLLVCIGAVLRLLRSLDDLVCSGESHHGLSLLIVKFREFYLVAPRESSGSPGNGIGGGPTDRFVRVIVPGDPDLPLVCNKGTLALPALYVDYVVSILLKLRGLEQVWQRDLLGLREIVTAVDAELTPLVVAPAPDLALAYQAVADSANLKPQLVLLHFLHYSEDVSEVARVGLLNLLAVDLLILHDAGIVSESDGLKPLGDFLMIP
jgi:hypothetical protein